MPAAHLSVCRASRYTAVSCLTGEDLAGAAFCKLRSSTGPARAEATDSRRLVTVHSARKANLPSLRAEQRLGALGKANDVRRERAQLKRELSAGRVEFERVISDPPPCAQTALVRDLLLALPGVGPTRADRALIRSRISTNKTIAHLSDRQRAALIQLLPLSSI